MKKIWFIVNPISGTQDKSAIVAKIPEYFPETRFSVEIKYTKYSGHAAEIAHMAVEQNVDIVVAVGGDGTVNETARALIHSNVALGIVPSGSGNGLARHLFLPMNMEGALQIISECNIHTLDYGLINGMPFFCTAGVGFDAFLSDRFNKSGKRGLLSYIEHALRDGLSYEPETYELDDFYIAPHASMADGLMDVTIMEPFTVFESPQIAYQLVHRTITQNSHIKTFRCKDLIIRRTKPGVIHVDGDPKDSDSEVRVSLVPKDIHMVVNINKQPWQPPLLKMFTDIYTGVSTPFKETPKKISRINEELLSKLRRKEQN